MEFFFFFSLSLSSFLSLPLSVSLCLSLLVKYTYCLVALTFCSHQTTSLFCFITETPLTVWKYPSRWQWVKMTQDSATIPKWNTLTKLNLAKARKFHAVTSKIFYYQPENLKSYGIRYVLCMIFFLINRLMCILFLN